VYVLSHGWHRNFFGALAAYDRLFARFVALARRGRLAPEDQATFLPLFFCLHWHSDPGSHDFEDREGRRHLPSFIQNARAAFEIKREDAIGEAEFLSDFENAFQLIAHMSAAGTNALDPDMDPKDEELLKNIHARYDLRGAPGATRSEKAAVAWTCYHEALVKQVLLSQQERSRRFGDPITAFKTLLKFAAAGGLLLVLAQHLSGLGKSLLKTWGGRFWDWYVGLPGIDSLLSYYRGAVKLPEFSLAHGLGLIGDVIMLAVSVLDHLWRGWVLILPLGVASILGLAAVAAVNQAMRDRRIKDKKAADQVSSGAPVPALIFWLPAQVVFIFPLLVFCALTYLFGGPVAWLLTKMFGPAAPMLFTERSDTDKPAVLPRELLAIPARWPSQLLRKAVSKDSKASGLADSLENQLAFFEMQRKAVDAGRDAGKLLAQILAALPEGNPPPKVHFIGHSFGASVVLNAVRWLSGQAQRPRIHTVCLLQGAVATGWLERETGMLSAVGGAIACGYSGYDLANGFYYPFANNCRLAAGYMGFAASADGRYPIFLGTKGEFASLVTPPTLDQDVDNIYAYRVKKAKERNPNLTEDQIKFIERQQPVVLNLDCSRFVYEGNPLLGGGHGDIFKNDVVHLVWAVTRMRG
jgi:hypothetical protein